MATKQQPEGITLQCTGCHERRVISFEDAATLKELPPCDNCFMPMVVLYAVMGAKRDHDS